MFEVPTKTTINTTEPTVERYALAFSPELAEFVKTGQMKTAYRFGKKYDYLQAGDEIEILNLATGESVGRARIASKAEVAFGDLPIATDRHESYRDKEHQRQVMSGYYAFLGRPIADEDPFLVFDLELL
ncbi:MAG TPA: hypothetical protein VLI05_02005 [Candidatus Saccharimonadia bacterium]|nr:hypothetical protein [Candidatus Saccharimonadia bacterium]